MIPKQDRDEFEARRLEIRDKLFAERDRVNNDTLLSEDDRTAEELRCAFNEFIVDMRMMTPAFMMDNDDLMDKAGMKGSIIKLFMAGLMTQIEQYCESAIKIVGDTKDVGDL